MELYDKKYVYFDWDDELEGKKGFFSDSINDLKRNVNNNNSWFGEIHKCTNSDGSFPFEFIDDSYNVYPFKFCYYDPFYEFRKAYLEGKQIQFKDYFDNWRDMLGIPIFSSKVEYRIKPKISVNNYINYSDYQSTEPRCYLSVNKNGYLEFTISQNITNNTIYNGTRKECERMMKIIADEFGEEVFSHWDTPRLRYIIDKYSHEKYKRRMTNRELAEYLAKGNGEVKNSKYIIGTSTSCVYKNNTENENVDDNILIRDFGSDEWREPLIEV